MIKYCIFLFLIIGFVECRQVHMATSQIYMDVKHNKKYLGRIIFGLFGDDAPKTVENFRQICINGINGKKYKGSRFHRVIERFIIQGGDIVSGDGTGSISIYGKYFDDENLTIQHTRSGYIGMANRGPNTNGCQFYITTSRTQWLDGKHTIFGKVTDGQDVVHLIEHLETDSEDRPLKPVIISKCGEIELNYPFEISDELYGVWNWIYATAPPVAMSFCILAVFHYFFRKLSMFC